ncbi:TetR family transcriptional regulator [Paracoccus caeni]|uniref:TetR family transcriptional regulator n=1 Tax=Paracoccus caeni TaxID=657651 RepID=A0A934SF97_9RHOB|nr:TetR/AcrR family transcriptional regulator [Paracoccus caeni]MBK4217790.1 TetR family transcriptional regulator [Paracoccus caeni]
MSASSSRRFRTAKRIQAKAVELAIRDGLTNTTTEAIARESGISTRTFFNYYPYKEAAIMGPPPDYPAEAAEQFVAAKGRLIDDLNVFIAAHLRRFLDERQMVKHIFELALTDAKLIALRNSAILARRSQMHELLARRMPSVDEVQIEILSSAIIAATNKATKDWANGQIDDFTAAALKNIQAILPSADLLNKQSR